MNRASIEAAQKWLDSTSGYHNQVAVESLATSFEIFAAQQILKLLFCETPKVYEPTVRGSGPSYGYLCRNCHNKPKYHTTLQVKAVQDE